jgi:hypothetical protein
MNSSMVNKDILSHSFIVPSIRGVNGLNQNFHFNIMQASGLFSAGSGMKEDNNLINSFGSFIVGNNAFGKPKPNV